MFYLETKKIICPFCGSEMNVQPSKDYVYHICECSTCGHYMQKVYPTNAMDNLKDETASFLFYAGNEAFHEKFDGYMSFMGDKSYYDNHYAQHHSVRYISEEEIRAFYPHTFAERISKILLGFATLAGFWGNAINLTKNELISAMFIKRIGKNGEQMNKEQMHQQIAAVTEYLKRNDYATFGFGNTDVRITLLAEGWKRIDDLQRSDDNNKKVFVSMAFNPGTDATREAIRAGIVEAGYSPEFIDEIIHNHQIVPEMLRLIRESRFLILDITDPNYGAYYEAGYALGLGKEVIISCSKEVFTKDYTAKEVSPYAKYLKPHFDVAQKQTLVWDDYNDLTKKLSEWIKAIIG